VAALNHLQPSTVVLTEVTRARRDQWSEALASIGLVQQADTTEFATKPEPYSVFIASTDQQEPEPWNASPPFGNRAHRVRVDGLCITAVLAPDKHRDARQFWPWIQNESLDTVATDALIIGDFNADQTDAAPALIRCVTPLLEAGWVDSLRRLHPNADHTSWWGNTPGFAIDHCYLSPTTAPLLNRAEILGEIAGATTSAQGLRFQDGAMSDHRPILIDLDGL